MQMTEEETCPHCGKNVNYLGQPLNLPAGYVVNGAHPYVLGAALGQGGFGITYIALDMVTGERVAIKEYFPTYCAGRTGGNEVTSYQNQEDVYHKGMERFLDEAKTLKSLSELKHIVNVLDFFEANNTAYLVMEYLDGRDLKETAANDGKFPAQKFLSEIKPLMEDIHRMHERGVIHRDIAPDNIIRLPDGQMMLIDFGTARSYLGEKSMTVVVKKGFAPVEQYLSKGATASSDVYALAATIYYCITGIVPPDSAEREYSNTPLERPTAHGADITPQQEKALLKALTVQQKDRTQTVQKFLNELFFQKSAPQKPVQKKPEKKAEKKAEKKRPEKKKPEKKKPAQQPEAGKQEKAGTDKDPKKGRLIAAAAAVLVVLILLITLLPDKPQTDAPAADTSPAPTESQTGNWQNNVMMASPLSALPQIPRNTIQSITFLDTCADAPTDAWDVSEAQDRSVLAWANANGSYYDICIAGKGGINAQNACEGLFSNCESLTQIHFGNAFHMEYAESMRNMFASCRSLTSLDIGLWDTSRVTDMESMFSSCSALTSLDVSGWDTSAVTNMTMAFFSCRGLTGLDVSGWNTAKVTTMRGMFASCWELTSLDVSGWDTSRVTDMSSMFASCDKLSSLDVSNWNVSNVTDYEGFMSDGQLISGRPWQALFVRYSQTVPMSGEKEISSGGSGNSSGGGGDVGGFLG